MVRKLAAGKRSLLPLLRDSSGQNLVEFALVVVMLMLLVVGIAEFGRAWEIYQVMTNAAREGARLASLPAGFATASGVTTRVNDYLALGGIDTTLASVSIGGAGVDGGTGTQVSITVTYPYTFLYVGPVIRLINPGATAGADVTIQAQVVMRNE
ncbi:MAG TPA: TadE family protein [Candidatus Polarisedimenticolia bacterium]|nr:TadE family protein [Candidatus Polarisedimenticolia bacterium]